MKIYDITQELFSSNVYPGDKKPIRITVSDMANGASCNISELEMNAHNGTHMDAPKHFIKDGAAIDELPIETLVGKCTVVTASGNIYPEFVRKVCEKGNVSRLLFRGKCQLTLEAADILSECGVKLIGVESQSIGEENAPLPVHVSVLGQGIAALEGLVLSDVPDGEYILFAAPLKLANCEGSPCRAVLVDKFDTDN